MLHWDKRDAAEELARQQLESEVGPCPHCGGPADFDLIDVTALGDELPRFVPGGNATCRNRCWLSDPTGYLNAVRSR